MNEKNKKYIRLGLIALLLLVVSFFWSGNKKPNPTEINKPELAEEDEVLEGEEAEPESLDLDDEDLDDEAEDEELSDSEEVEVEEEDAGEKEKKQDEYKTDPVPEGKPEPVESQDQKLEKDKKLTATLSVNASSILNNKDDFNPDKLGVLPDDGIIYSARKVEFFEGESAFDLLLREMKDKGIHMEFQMTPVYNSHYIEGINNIYEFDCGELSGWMYRVNGWFPNYGISRYKLEDGDVLELLYTCDLGEDIGGYNDIKGE